MEASRLRLRPILMTSFAFILGVVPLVIATGAGAEMRQSLGTAVFSGMLGVTLFGIFLTPVFFYVIQGLSEMRLFASGAIRRVGSYLVGGLSGFAVVFLLARIAHLRTAVGGGDQRYGRDPWQPSGPGAGTDGAPAGASDPS